MESITIRISETEMEFVPFCPPPWMRNNHFQTLASSQLPRRWSYGWKTWEEVEIGLGNEGKLIAEVSWQPGSRSDAPLLILLHGLEGSARSNYLVGLSRKAFAGGFHTARVNTRNCGGTEHLTPTLYSAALSGDILYIVRHFREAFGIRSISAAGVSLGANILLKFLGEQGEQGSHYIQAAAVVSAPIDLDAAARKMDGPQSRFYQQYFLRKLIARMKRKAEIFPGVWDMREIARVRSIREFDDLVTAPHFGFGSADNYYRLASSGRLLDRIKVPTLMLQSKDDPLIPYESYCNGRIGHNSYLELVVTKYGGHAGFLQLHSKQSSDLDGHWAESRIVQFLSYLAQKNGSMPTRAAGGTYRLERKPGVFGSERDCRA